MRNRRLVMAVVAVGVALGLTGCGPEDTAKTPTGAAGATAAAQAASQLDPKADLAAAAKKLADQSMKIDMDMSGQMSMSGVADTKARLAKVSMSMGALGGDKIEMRMIKDDLYLKAGSLGAMLGGKGGGKTWMHIDAAKLSEGSSFNLSPNGDDPAGTQAMISALTEVERVGDTGFQGTLDLSKSPRFKKGAMAGLGDKLTKIPFTAKKDGEGRLVEMTLDMSGLGAGAGKMKTTYHDFGTPVSVEAPPASEVQEMPSQLSGILNA
ncbi:hypothetical protein [Couchioplanes azureus]|uniref:hypothetical protein n=1 Tax=Couchioplanes caeruleus TaxID=56438 RepID=UPI00167027F6|nr:hypothetical protein [Couchioplanes caeruleus]GGQ39318.1 hypothetical protein GCM10010166_02610 [Couchioplanes caeruleus subsp. azureus]